MHVSRSHTMQRRTSMQSLGGRSLKNATDQPPELHSRMTSSGTGTSQTAAAMEPHPAHSIER